MIVTGGVGIAQDPVGQGGIDVDLLGASGAMRKAPAALELVESAHFLLLTTKS